MEIKWYGLAQWLGLVEDIAYQYNDGYTHYRVSGRTGDVFSALTLSLIPLLLIAGFLLRRFAGETGRKIIKAGGVLLLIYAVLLAVGVGPYFILYPKGGGFLDFTTLEHIVTGIYTALLALCLHISGRFGKRK